MTEAVVISLASSEQAEVLYPRLRDVFEQVAGYCQGRRCTGGPVHIAEGRFRRLHPEYLLRSAVLLVMASESAALDALDSVLGLVARLTDPSGATVELISLSGQTVNKKVGSAGR